MSGRFNKDNTHSPDLVDQANDTADLFRDIELAHAQGRSAPEKDARFDGVHCVEEACGVDLPEGRLKLGRIRCIECQQLKEQQATRSSRPRAVG